MNLYTVADHLALMEKGLEKNRILDRKYYIENWGETRIELIKSLLTALKDKDGNWKQNLDALYDHLKGAWGYFPHKVYISCYQCKKLASPLVEFDIETDDDWGTSARICPDCLRKGLELAESEGESCAS